MVKMLADTCDRNDDGVIKEAEVVVGFAEVLGTSRECFWFVFSSSLFRDGICCILTLLK